MLRSQIKIQQYIKGNTLIITWDLFRGCKDGSRSTNQCDKLQNEEQKSYYLLNRCKKKCISQNSISIPDKNSQQSGFKGNISQCDKGHI